MTSHGIETIVIGGSAGAFEALSCILPALPRDFRIPIVLVLHLPPSKPSSIPEALAEKCGLSVKEPEDKEPIEPGVLYVAPPNYHVLIERRLVFSLSVDAPVHFSRPSIDVLFETAAAAYRQRLLGILLSGGNQDGARGLAAIKERGGIAVVQSPESSSVSAMPEAALALTAPDFILSPADIGALCARLPGSIARVRGGTAQNEEVQ